MVAYGVPMQPGFFPASPLASAFEVLGRGKKTGPKTQLHPLQDFMRGHCNLECAVYMCRPTAKCKSQVKQGLHETAIN